MKGWRNGEGEGKEVDGGEVLLDFHVGAPLGHWLFRRRQLRPLLLGALLLVNILGGRHSMDKELDFKTHA